MRVTAQVPIGRSSLKKKALGSHAADGLISHLFYACNLCVAPYFGAVR